MNAHVLNILLQFKIKSFGIWRLVDCNLLPKFPSILVPPTRGISSDCPADGSNKLLRRVTEHDVVPEYRSPFP